MPIPPNETPTATADSSPEPLPAIRTTQLECLLALCAALLLGAGLIFWIAANWPDMPRQFKYHMLQTAVLLPALAALRPGLRQPGLLLAMLALGGLLAFVGQTYQTGADTWQLFAAWAALSVPWAVGARSDALWALWILIAGAGLGLWSHGHLNPAVLPLADQRTVWLDSLIWLPLAALPVALAHFRLIGAAESPRPATISRRLAAFLATCVWSVYALLALFSSDAETGGAALRYLLNATLILLIGGSVWIARPRDFVVLANVALALNLIILGLVAKGLFDGPFHNDDFIGALLLFALIAAATVGGSSVWLYRVQRQAGGRSDAMRHASAGKKPPARSSTTVSWVIATLNFIGAQFVVVPFLLFLFLAGGETLLAAPGIYMLSALLLITGITGLRARAGQFIAQLCLCAILSAMGLLVFAHFFHGLDGIAWILTLIALTAGMLIDETWIQRILGSIAAACFMWITLGTALDRPFETAGLFHSWENYPHALNAALLALSWCLWQGKPSIPASRLSTSIDALFDGIGLAVLLALAYGENTVLTAALTWRETVDPMDFTGTAALFPSLFRFDPVTAAQCLLTVVAFIWLVWRSRLLAADQRRRLYLIGLVFAQLTLFTPLTRHGGTLSLIIAGAFVAHRRWILTLAGLVLLAKLSGFYYALQWPLADKAALLAGAGMALGLLLWLIRALASSPAISHGAIPTAASIPSPLHITPALALLLAAPALALGLVHWDVSGKEKVIAEGRKIFIPLAPRDPRSLLQGDYMALNFAFPPKIVDALPDGRGNISVIARLDPRGVATAERLAERHGTDGESLAADEILLPLKRMNHGWTLVTDAFYFPEGRGKPFIQARFGEFRALPDGRVLLVGLADAHLQAIQPAPTPARATSGRGAP